MIKGKKITLCLPCRNEGENLRQVVKQIPPYIDEIIIVSNASTDNTVQIAKRIGRKVKVIEDNRTSHGIGYGFAHISGIKAAHGDIIIGADADGTYPVEKIDRMVQFLIQNRLDFITCTRYPVKANTKIPLKLQIGVQLLNWEVRLLYGIKARDILSGMWLFRREVRELLNLSMGDWNLSPQIKINAATNPDISYDEYSINQRQRLGETKQNYLKTGFSHAWWILKNRFTIQRGTTDLGEN